MRGVSDVLLYRFAAWISTRKYHFLTLVRILNTYPLGFSMIEHIPFSLAFLRTAKEGAATQIYCAVNPELNTQEAIYYNDCAPDESSEVSR